ncbi:MAG: hypothetical protein ACR2QB_05525 [Gammaproteobacteria bacterium]
MNEPDGKTTTPEQEAFAARLGQRLRDSAEELDGPARSRLNQARHSALQEIRPRSWWLGAPALAGLATAAVAIIAVSLWLPATQAPQPLVPEGIQETDLELLMAEESLDMLEDLEFYTWLAMAELDGGSAG